MEPDRITLNFGGVLHGDEAAGIVGLLILYTDASPKHLMKSLLYDNLKAQGIDGEAEGFVLADITMPCGERKKYRKISDLPDKNKQCPCGSKWHWLVRYVRVPDVDDEDK
jgi:hypothetical protein